MKPIHPRHTKSGEVLRDGSGAPLVRRETVPFHYVITALSHPVARIQGDYRRQLRGPRAVSEKATSAAVTFVICRELL